MYVACKITYKKIMYLIRGGQIGGDYTFNLNAEKKMAT
jgi:hypothetical protein